MESINISFSANRQTLTGGGLYCASNTVHYIIADFELGDGWDGFDSVRAVWSNDFKCISTVLDQSGSCAVPHEVLERRGKVSVNLVGSILEDDELTDRLTTYPVLAITVDANAKICGTETAEVTPSQFEQYVAIVIAEVEKVTGMTAVAQALPEGSAPTASYSDGVLTLGIPKGDTGATGNGISSVEFNEDYSLTFYFTDSEPFTTPSIRGAQGARGYGIASVEKIGSAGLVDTYRINFEDPSVPPTTFTVTNGEEGPQGPRGYTGETGNGIDRIELTDTTGAVKTYTIYFTDGSTYDFEVTDGEVTLAELASVLPTDTASGSIASFPDGSDLFDYLSCIVNIEPVQAGSGTPSPQNVRPITGWTGCEVDVVGKNLFDIGELVELGTGVSEITNGYRFSVSGAMFSTGVSFKKPFANPVTISMDVGNISGTNLRFRVVHTDGTENEPAGSGTGSGGHVTLTTTKPIKGIKFNWSSAGVFEVTNFQMEFGSTETDYKPYSSTTYPVSWQTEAGTVYGGTVDLVSGVLTKTHALVDGGSLTWIYWYASLFYASISGKTADSVTDIKCEVYGTTTGGTGQDPDGIFCQTADVQKQNAYIKDNTLSKDATGAAALKTKLSGHNIWYRLATPQTYQLDPVQVACLLGQNNVWADCGDTSVTYKADVQLWVEKKLGE